MRLLRPINHRKPWNRYTVDSSELAITNRANVPHEMRHELKSVQNGSQINSGSLLLSKSSQLSAIQASRENKVLLAFQKIWHKRKLEGYER